MQNSQRQSFPLLSDELLAALDKMYPVSRPLPGEALDTIMYYSGQRSVVEELRNLRDWQVNNRQVGVSK